MLYSGADDADIRDATDGVRAAGGVAGVLRLFLDREEDIAVES